MDPPASKRIAPGHIINIAIMAIVTARPRGLEKAGWEFVISVSLELTN